ncbi:hypothetical protein [Chryseobacterium sp. 2987]|uniref:hypothetical protein n=1 Tax=Chryseobacterium sp. 2987 TaxID=2817767 RepID=UPI0028639D61|nr:hypothetical protein [Chryseobacterium sp. 2987]MDR6920508.1 hypothetical protein [Chryseobacterium sp. 2987]
MKPRINKIVVLLLILFCFESCNSQTKKQKQYKDERNAAFKEYLNAQKIPFKELNDSIFSAYYGDFLFYEKKLRLESNPYLKVNKVYIHYITPASVQFVVYSDEETFCMSTVDLDMDGKILSFPENGVVKVLQPINLQYFGDYELAGNIIKTRKSRESPYKETYYYVNGSIKNDTIHFTERYEGKSKKFEKKILAKKHKEDFTEVYQPGLSARKFINNANLVSYEVTGEFNIGK